jgi:large subunit ribosomal protein L7/L12
VNLPTGGDLEGRVRTLMAEGRKIEAIEVHREVTGAGLKEAKDAVEGLDLSGGLSHRLDVGQDIEPELLSLPEQGRKIRAIKVYRERTGVGLKEAKDAVEALGRRHGIVPKGAGCAGLLLLALILSGLLGLMIGGLV